MRRRRYTTVEAAYDVGMTAVVGYCAALSSGALRAVGLVICAGMLAVIAWRLADARRTP